MIQSKSGVCSECGKTAIYGNVTKKLCIYCNKKRLNAGKIKKAPSFKKRKNTGERDLFAEIWDKRPHVCEWCGIPIKEPSPSNFAHIKSKSTHPELRLDSSNIQLLCYDCHYALDFRGSEIFEKRKGINER